MKPMKNKRKWICIPAVLVVLCTAVFLVYTGQYYHADHTAEEALRSGQNIQVTALAEGWFFDGPSEEYALIFYPGGKVEESAYAPLSRRLAQKGIDVYLVRMPFHLAIFGQNKAEEILRSHDYKHWYIGGHSLGGVVASMYASEHSEELDGVVLLASYTTKKLNDKLNTILLYGSDDEVLNAEEYQKNRENLPVNADEYIIEGGNHAQFGSYGLQKGDGEAEISFEEQLEQTVDILTDMILKQLSKE